MKFMMRWSSCRSCLLEVLNLLLIISIRVNIIIAFNDDDIISTPNIPFCRQGHAQISIENNAPLGNTNIDPSFERTKSREQVLIFGGKGINYRNPDESCLNDLWILKIFDDMGTLSRTVTDIASRPKTESIYNKFDDTPIFEWKQIREMPNSIWPSSRWDFASTSVRIEHCETFFPKSNQIDDISNSNTKMIIFGGETDVSHGLYGGSELNRFVFDSNDMRNSIDYSKYLSDLWILVNETYWMHLYSEEDFEVSLSSSTPTAPHLRRAAAATSSNTSYTLLNSFKQQSIISYLRQQMPGPRRGAMLATMPLSQTVVLFGGEGLYVDSGSQTSTSTSSTTTTGSNSNSNSGSIIERIVMTCLSDVFTVNITAAILQAQRASKNAPTSPLHPPMHSFDDDGFNFYRHNIWSRGEHFSGPCLLGAAAVGVWDPSDHLEKMFVFGGRYLSSSSSSNNNKINNSSISGSGSNSNSGDSGRYRSSSDSSQQMMSDSINYVYNNDILLYEPTQKRWTNIPAALCWPTGRQDHRLSYSASLHRVVLSGGRRDTAETRPPSHSFNSSSSSSDSCSYCHSHTTSSSSSSSGEVDMWFFDLTTRRWHRPCPPLKSPSPLKSVHKKEQLHSLSATTTTTIATTGTASAASTTTAAAVSPLAGQQWGGSYGEAAGDSQAPEPRYAHSMSLLRDPGSSTNSGEESVLKAVIFGGRFHRDASSSLTPTSTTTTTTTTNTGMTAGSTTNSRTVTATSTVTTTNKMSVADKMDIIPKDDADRHSEMNDVWLYSSPSSVSTSSSSFSTSSGWQQVSSGGCHVGDTGLVAKHLVDTSALVFIYVIAVSAVLGMLCYHFIAKFISSSRKLQHYQQLEHQQEGSESIEMQEATPISGLGSVWRSGYASIPEQAHSDVD